MKCGLRVLKTILPAAVFLSTVAAGGRTWAAGIEGTVTAKGMRSAANIAVYVDAIPGKQFSPPSRHSVMDQKQLTFIPHVLVVLKGTTVDFLNSDSVGHNVYWPAISGNKKLAHNMGTWSQGTTKSFTFSEPGVAPLLCNVHPQMSGYVVVVPTPYFALTDSDGKYRIENVPPGHYVLKVWSEEAKPVSQPVDVSGATATVNLTVHR